MSNYDLWPYSEAQKLAGKIKGQRKKAESQGREIEDPTVRFETGFGPSGLPHLGHFSENARTSWVQRAFEVFSDAPTELIVFSDDMDGLRKVPSNLPNQEMLEENLGKPLCDIPDPHGEAESFAAYMNARLREFLDSFGFDYTFKSSKDQYRNGVFDEGLEGILENYDEIRDVIVQTLREENREDWSPFFPVCDECGKVYTTRVTDIHPDDGEISYVCDDDFRGMTPCGHEAETPVTGGNVKVGWKVDWALRWYTFGIDYEMYGKDLIDSAKLSGKIVDILGGNRPLGQFYEMFLDENGEKISSSEGGGGLTIDEWLSYAPLESLAWFLFQNPQKAKKLHFDVIPRSVDSWLDDRRQFADSDDQEDRRDNPVWFVERGRVDDGEDLGIESDISYSMLLNLVSALNTEDREVVREYVLDYDPAAEQDDELLEELIDGALQYYRDFVLPTKEYEAPPEALVPAVEKFRDFLADYDGEDPEEIQNAAYDFGKESDADLGDWFTALYRMLLGQDEGPRLGSFIYMFGVEETVEALNSRLADRNS
jgi:lysyl-tRNA synthetase class 1